MSVGTTSDSGHETGFNVDSGVFNGCAVRECQRVISLVHTRCFNNCVCDMAGINLIAEESILPLGKH